MSVAANRAQPVAFDAQASRSPLTQSLLALRRDRMAVLGLTLYFALVVVAIFADQIAPYDPAAIHMRDRLQGPSASYLLGTDELGRDLLSRLIHGARISMAVGFVSAGIGCTLGVMLGLIAGYRGGATDSVIMRLLDGVLAFPSLILAMAIVSALGPSVFNAMIAIGIVSIPTFARITRGSVLSLKEKEFVEAGRAIGAGDFYLMFRVLLPNCLSPLLVQISISFSYAILTESALSFLGIGVQPPTPSWGAMLDTGRKFLSHTAWYAFTAGAAIFLAVLSLNLIGDGLRDALDPRLRKKI